MFIISYQILGGGGLGGWEGLDPLPLVGLKIPPNSGGHYENIEI